MCRSSGYGQAQSAYVHSVVMHRGTKWLCAGTVDIVWFWVVLHRSSVHEHRCLHMGVMCTRGHGAVTHRNSTQLDMEWLHTGVWTVRYGVVTYRSMDSQVWSGYIQEHRQAGMEWLHTGIWTVRHGAVTYNREYTTRHRLIAYSDGHRHEASHTIVEKVKHGAQSRVWSNHRRVMETNGNGVVMSDNSVPRQSCCAEE